jgi:hypothetical protein
MEVSPSYLRGSIYIDPSATNPQGRRPFDYGPYEHARGGEHAFYDRTLSERGDSTMERMLAMVAREIF